MTYFHVDVDNLWSYEREFNLKMQADQSLIYKYALPKFLKMFQEHKVKATFFIVGKDLDLPEAREFIKKALENEHEIANHTFSHSVNFGSLSLPEKKNEILKCHNAILNATGIAPVGFRSPGYYADKDLFKILKELNYKYDSSVLPSYINLIMPIFFFIKTGKFLKKIFGKKRFLFSSQNITRVDFDRSSILEVPITTAPLIRVPVHSTFQFMFGKFFQKITFSLLKMINTSHKVILFHAIDLLDEALLENHYKSIPTLNTPISERTRILDEMITISKDQESETLAASINNLNPTKFPTSLLFKWN